MQQFKVGVAHGVMTYPDTASKEDLVEALKHE